MKIIAYYLPQFHEVKENDEWWGKGFTEWINVKKARPLYKNHKQPNLPLDNNYYNLLNKESVIWQTKLANEYGVDGFCYYHYWFKGKKILEKPAENLLKWKDISQNFCFCWANHDWKKTWNGTNQLLIRQEYGEEKEWEEHFQYLLPFFKDNRYIKIGNKPILMIFNAEAIPKVNKRIEYYNKRCEEYGLEGIYVIESLNSKKNREVIKKAEGVVLREPSLGWDNLNIFYKILHQLKRKYKKNFLYFPSHYSFKKIANLSLKYAREFKSNKQVYLGSFTAWDSTPRHGRRGYIIENENIYDFREYLKLQFEISKEKKSDIIFINAWNEWAEGMILEPTFYDGYKYLEIIKELKKEWNSI